jgi:hypothetical protein
MVKQKYSTVEWVDVETVARVPLKFVIYLKKYGKPHKMQTCYIMTLSR